MQELNFHIVIPAHNEAQFLGETLSSLVSQTHKPKQLVIVNDNSTDQTLSIAETFSKDYSFSKIDFVRNCNNYFSDSDHLFKEFQENLRHSGFGSACRRCGARRAMKGRSVPTLQTEIEHALVCKSGKGKERKRNKSAQDL